MVNAFVALYVGTWNCSKPTDRSGYATRLTVSRQSDGRLDFISSGVASSGGRGLLFSIAPASNGTWTLRSVDYPYTLTGTWNEGSITFSPPPPNPHRFQLRLTNRDQTMSYVSYKEYDFPMYRQYQTTECTRG
jgi:hypothetical protein